MSSTAPSLSSSLAKRQQSVHEMSRNASVEAYMKLKKTGSLSTGVGDAKGDYFCLGFISSLVAMVTECFK